MALSRERGRAGGLAIVMLFTASVVFADAASARSGYPFLVADLPQAPPVVYVPMYIPVGVKPSGLRLMFGGRGVEMHEESFLESGGSLDLIESTRVDATAEQFVGSLIERDIVRGALTMWRRASTAGGTNVLYGRIGGTLVVISAPLSFDELLRIADSLRRTTPGTLML